MRTTIRKWGNSLGVRNPSAIAEDVRLHDGAEVDVTVREDQLVIVPLLSLAELVAGITAANHYYSRRRATTPLPVEHSACR